MKTVQLSGSPRVNVGKKGAKATRNEGLVPCVLYGQGEQVHFAVKSIDLERIIFSPNVFQVELDIDGVKKRGVIREVQQHPVKDTLMHVDFYELDDKKPVRVGLPIRLNGTARGVLNGGRMQTVFRKLTCVGLPGDLPEEIVIDVAPLRIGHAVRVNQIQIPGVTILEPANAVVCSVKMARGAADDSGDDDEEEGAEAAAEETSAE